MQVHKSLNHIPLGILHKILREELFNDSQYLGFIASDVALYMKQNVICSGCMEGKSTDLSSSEDNKVEDLTYETDTYDSIRGDVMIVRKKHYLFLLLHWSRWAFNFPMEGDTYSGLYMLKHFASVKICSIA